MTPAFQHNVGAFLTAKIGTVPEASSGDTVNGTGFDRTDWESLLLIVETGAATGTPSAVSVVSKIQHSSDDGSSDAYADYTPTLGSASVTVAAASTAGSVAVDLAEAKQYIRVVTTTTLTSGTTPTLGVAAVVALGGALVNPASNIGVV